MMIGFGVIALYRWHQTQLIFFLLLVLRDFAAGCYFLKRKPAKDKAKFIPSLLAYISAALPLCYFAPIVTNSFLFLISDLLAILGFLLVVFATIELGSSIGISPANRGLVSSGVYSFFKHPMYVGYTISELGFVLLNFSNVYLLILSCSFYLFRIIHENRILDKKLEANK